jgi:hypothetical protein
MSPQLRRLSGSLLKIVMHDERLADALRPQPLYSVAPLSAGGSARQTYRYFSSLDVTTGIFFSRVTRFKAERRFCIFSPFRPNLDRLLGVQL